MLSDLDKSRQVRRYADRNRDFQRSAGFNDRPARPRTEDKRERDGPRDGGRGGQVPSASISNASNRPYTNGSKGKGRETSQNGSLSEDEDEGLRDTQYRPQRALRNADDMTIIHNLQLGPKEFKPVPSDPEWQLIEPYSGIRLK